ncbi:MAG: A24 family peptidase [Acidobacteriaceae bacterium]
MPVPTHYVPELFAFVAGLVFGSFLNVCISRLPHGESIVQPRSRCARCHHTIQWYDNIPLVSFFVLRGRCRRCRKSISSRYPLVELATALWFVLAVLCVSGEIFHSAVATVQLLSITVLGFLLIGLAVMDWQTLRLPDAFTFTGIGIGFFFACVQAIFLNPGQGQILLPAQHMRLRSPGVGAIEGNVFLTGPEALVFGRFASIVLTALLLLLTRWAYQRLRHREGMGLGDVKLLAMIAAFLGLAQSLLALFLGVITAAIAASVLLATRRATLATRLPFGSFLCAGGLVAALLGPSLLHWYTSLFR